MEKVESKRRPAYRDGVEMWTEGEVFTAPGGEVVEVLYETATGEAKQFFVELPGIPACAHGATVDEAINEARAKREGLAPLTDAEKAEYSAENFKFSVLLFRRVTGACRSGTAAWLAARGLDRTTTMTLSEIRAAGGGAWAEELAERLR